MLNISENTIFDKIDTSQYRSFQATGLTGAHQKFKRWMLATLFLFLVFLFLPWTQTIQTVGNVTTLRPEQRPQTIHSTIAGRIEKWYVQEGQLVQKGDTILYLSEIKTDYFDPELVNRTGAQVAVTEASVQSYDKKAEALENQIKAMQGELQLKKRQLVNKIAQGGLKVQSDSIDLVRAEIDLQIAERQYNRARELYEKGLESLTKLEDKNLKFQEANAKKIGQENKLLTSRNELDNNRIELVAIENEYISKIAKAESDRFSTLSEKFAAEAKGAKLRTEYSSYSVRAGFYYITAPQDCYITKALVPGLGETVKEGQAVVRIMPKDFQLAVAMDVSPIDLPLISYGNKVNFVFDGWPAFVFSGWPNLTFGTYSGSVVAIDNEISTNGSYRILVTPGEDDRKWPEALRVGSGAKCIALLNDVPIWYEIWRKLNSFPPDFYKRNKGDDASGQKDDSGQLKHDAPIKSLK